METLNSLTTTFTPPSNPKPLLHPHFLLHHRHHPPPPPPPPPRPLKHLTTPLYLKPRLKSPKYPPPPSSPKSPKCPSSSLAHHRPASGYAAAILDIAIRDGALGSVIRDMGRLGRVMRRSEMRELMMDEEIWGEVVKGVVREMAVGEMVCGLVELLVGKTGGGGVAVLGEVVGEFDRILGELSGRIRPVGSVGCVIG